jgi:multidrug resistance efflux pump
MGDIVKKNIHDDTPLEERIYSLKTINPPKSAKVLAYWVVGMMIFAFICLFLPWQQNIEGVGQITALTPQDRPQEVQTAIPGRINEWRIKEGDFVNQGDTIVVLAEIKDDYFDPEFLPRLREQVGAKEEGIEATQTKISALNKQIGALEAGLNFKLTQTQNKYQQARMKVISDSAAYEAEKVSLSIAQRQFKSFDSLFNAKPVPLISQTDWERRQKALQEAQAKIVAMQNKYAITQNEFINARIELNSVEAEYLDKISKAQSDRSSSLGYLADAKGELSKIRNKYANMVIRNNQYYITAPQSGYVVKTLKTGIGETIKDTDAICTIQPATPAIAAEVYIRAMDVPLIAKGRKVRLEFDGWPALQVTGWPSVAVGTFGGEIKVIDYVDSKEGKYRILVVPDKNEPWPRQLRVGSGVYAWVMLNDVPVWFEIWRQLNGFPPSLYEDPDKAKEDPKKKSGHKMKVKVKK